MSSKRIRIYPQNNEDGSTRVEPLRGSNGRPISIILRFLSILSDAFTLLLKKLYEIFDKISYKGKQSLKTFPMRLLSIQTRSRFYIRPSTILRICAAFSVLRNARNPADF